MHLALVSLMALHFGTYDVTSLFFVSKSENKNEVHYGVHLDAECRVDRADPIYAYWQMNEGRTPHVESLLPREESAYGIATQTIAGSTIKLVLRALRDRPIVVQVERSAAGCVATASTTIAHTRTPLDHVFVQLAWPFGVSYLELFGKTPGFEERIGR